MSEVQLVELKTPKHKPLVWDDWRSQLRHSINTIEELRRWINVTEAEEQAIRESAGKYRWSITPYYASLMDQYDANCPIRRQAVPSPLELQPFPTASVDPVGDMDNRKTRRVVHKYPDRVIILATESCPVYCRHCTRKYHTTDLDGTYLGEKEGADWEKDFEYIAKTPQIRDVLLTGGDPLTLGDKTLEWIVGRLRKIPHVEIIRFGSRYPVLLPQRITPELCQMLEKYHPIWLNTHFNHPKEITPEVEAALTKLANAGIPLGCQSVLMAGINDCPNIMMDLVHKLVKNRVRPYYLYQCDLVHGAGHFRTPVAKGIEIIEALRGHTSGYAVPTYVIDAPEGGGKVPVMPTYMLSMSTQHVVVRNYEGHISSYTQPSNYQEHDTNQCSYCKNASHPDGVINVAGLLAGEAKTIVPEHWQAAHNRVSSIPTTIVEAASDQADS